MFLVSSRPFFRGGKGQFKRLFHIFAAVFRKCVRGGLEGIDDRLFARFGLAPFHDARSTKAWKNSARSAVVISVLPEIAFPPRMNPVAKRVPMVEGACLAMAMPALIRILPRSVSSRAGHFVIPGGKGLGHGEAEVAVPHPAVQFDEEFLFFVEKRF